MPTGEPKSLTTSRKHLPNLDGLRTLAALCVFLQHCNHFPIYAGAPYFVTGWLQQLCFSQAHLGVQFFFVLSGFLITRIVLSQKQEGSFRLLDFWKRRIVRIWPVYFLVCLLSFALTFSGWPNYQMPHNSWPMVLGFLENYDLKNMLAHGQTQGYVVSVLWSVSIEEQFYFIYPLLLLLVPRRFYTALFVSILVLSGAYKLTVGPQTLDGQFQTWSACYELGFGCLLAMLTREVREPSRSGWFSLAYLCLLGVLLVPGGAVIALLRPPLFCAILFDQAFCPRSKFQTQKIPALGPLGKLTYGFYSYHIIFVILVDGLLRRNGLEPRSLAAFLGYIASAGLLALAASAVSYFYMERPLLTKERASGELSSLGE